LKKFIFKAVVAVGIAGFLISCNTGRDVTEITRFLIDSIQSQRVPDSRVAIFAIKAVQNGDTMLLTGKTTEKEALNELFQGLERQDIPFTDSILRLPDSNLGDHTWGLVTLSVANIRYSPSQSAEMATQALMGTPVKILQEDNGYFLIQTPDNYISWTESAGIAPIDQNRLQAWKSNERVIFTGDFGLVYSEPQKDSDPVSDLVSGGILEVDSNKGASRGFVPVILPDGRTGFIESSQCADFQKWLADRKEDPENLIRLAKRFTGRPYLWGGTSAKAFDCSGFTKTIYFMNGWILSRDASQQVNQGTEIDRTNLLAFIQPGDLLFFGRKATDEKPERATHVGMYTGDSFFIHCSGLVRINSLDSSRPEYKKYYTENLLHVKRILGTPSQPVTIRNHPWYN